MEPTVDVACLIHGNMYDWQYVESLYSMIQKNTSYKVRFHVLTEQSRAVPEYMIKHDLIEWPGVFGPKRAWWYKLQLFYPGKFNKTTTYFDLDTVIIDNIDSIFDLDSKYFWSILDFKVLWKPQWRGINSSFMRWNPENTAYIWEDFKSRNIDTLIKQYHGDQDYLTRIIKKSDLRYVDQRLVKSWKWQVLDGGLDTATRCYRNPGRGPIIEPGTKVICFHGSPKPHEVTDRVIVSAWHTNKNDK